MSLNGSGVAVINSAGQPVVASTLIDATVFNALTADLATMLSTAIFKDGQQTITANIPMSNYVFTGLGSGIAARTRSANIGDVQDGAAMWGGTAGGTANALTITLSPAITAYAAGQRIYFKSGTSANTGAATLAVNGLTAKAIQSRGAALSASMIEASKWYGVLYDGAAYQLFALEIPMNIRDRAPLSIVNKWSSGGVSGVAVDNQMAYAKKILSGALTADTYAELVSVTGAGLIDVIGVNRQDATSRTVGLKVVIDGTTVFDASDGAAAANGQGFWAIFANIPQATTAPLPMPDTPIPFYTSLSVWVKQSLSETDKVALFVKYRTV